MAEAVEQWQPLLRVDGRYREADWVGEKLDWQPPLVDEARQLISKLS